MVDVFGLVSGAAWLVAGLAGRYQIMQLYREREHSELELNIFLTAAFGAWYLNYEIRPFYPSLERS